MGCESLSEFDLSAQGITYRKIPLRTARIHLDVMKMERGYVSEDVVELSPLLKNFELLCAKFCGEHAHTDDEVRYVLEGEGFFDIRSLDDRWLRVFVEPGDLIIVPSERYHRFMLTAAQHIKTIRLFKDSAGWEPIYRPDPVRHRALRV